MNNSDQRAILMGTAPIPRLLVQFSIPVMTGMIVAGLYNVINRIFIGNYSPESASTAIAAITIGMPIMFVTMAFNMMIGFGGAAVISIYLGEKQHEKAQQVLGNGYSLAMLVGLTLMTISLVFLDPLLKLMGASDAVMPYAKLYNGIILIGSVPGALGYGISNYIRAEGNPRWSGMIVVFGALLNILFDFILIVHMHWGLKGAAIGTVLSQTVVAVLVFFYFTSGKSHIKLRLSCMAPKLAIIKRIASVGSSAFVQQIGTCFVQFAFNNQLKTYGGDTAIAAWGLIQTIALFFLFPIFGINGGSQPLIGFNYGARDFRRVRHAVTGAIIGATAFVVVAFALIQLFTPFIIGIFAGHDKELIKVATYGIRVFALLLPTIGFQVIASGYFTSVGKPIHSIMLSLSRQVIFLLPLVWIMPHIWKLNGIFWAVPVSDCLALFVTGAFFAFEILQLKKKQKNVEEERRLKSFDNEFTPSEEAPAV